jgi:hypothetical protein
MSKMNGSSKDYSPFKRVVTNFYPQKTFWGEEEEDAKRFEIQS